MQERGGSTARPTAKLADGNTPYRRHHAQLMNGGWPRGRDSFFLQVQSFLRVQTNLRSLLRDRLCNWSSGVETKCTVYCLFHIIIVIFFVVLLNCLYLNPGVLPFSILLPTPLGVRRSE